MNKDYLENELAKGLLKIDVNRLSAEVLDSNDYDLILLFAQFCDTNNVNKKAIEFYLKAIDMTQDDDTKANLYNTTAGIFFMKLHDIKKTIEYSHKAVALYRKLAKHNPTQYNEPLANLLNNLASISYQAVDKEVALDLAIEAFDLSLYLVPISDKYVYILESALQNGISIALDIADESALKYLFAKSIEMFRVLSDTHDKYQKKLDYYTKALEDFENNLI